MNKLKGNQKGFTLVELLIATTVFSIILLVAGATLIQIGRLYYKGVITSRTQNVARNAIDEVTRSIQFSSGDLTQASDGYIQAFCFGNTRYTYILGAQVDDSVPNGKSFSDADEDGRKVRHVLWRDKIGNQLCGDDLPDLTQEDPYQGSPGNTQEGRELLENGMRLENFEVSEQGERLFRTSIKVIYYASGDLLDNLDDPEACRGSSVGGQWCAISELTSVVYSRVEE